MSRQPVPDGNATRRRGRFIRTVGRIVGLARLLWPLAKPHAKLLASGASLGVLLVILKVATPWPLKLIVDALTDTGAEPVAGLWKRPEIGVAILGAVYVAIAVGAAVCEYGQRLLLAGLGNRIVHQFRSDVFDHVLRLPLPFHEQRETGELLTRVIYDTARLRQGVNGLLTRVFQNAFLFLLTIGVLLWIDVGLALVVGISGVLTLRLMGRSTRRIRRASRRSRKKEGRLAAVVSESLLGIREWQTFRPGAGADDRFRRQNARSLRDEQKVRRLAAGLVLRVEVVLAAAVALVLLLGTNAVLAGRLTTGDLVLFAHYTIALYRPYRQFARQAARMGRTFACAERLTGLMSRKPAITDRPDAVPALSLRGDIVFEGVSVKSRRRRRGGRKWLLRDVAFRVEPGSRVGIVGHNGAGKSTLLRLVLRLIDPSGGVVRIDGRDAREYTIESLRRQTSVAFQESAFFGLTVRENIALGRDGVPSDEVRRAAERTRIAPMIERLPNGYETIVRRRGGLFSVGERQRIAIARALMLDGRIWLLDEPTAGVDSGTAEELVRLLLRATRDRTVLWVTHNPAILSEFDQLVVLSGGRVEFAGTPAEYDSRLAHLISSGSKVPHDHAPERRDRYARVVDQASAREISADDVDRTATLAGAE